MTSNIGSDEVDHIEGGHSRWHLAMCAEPSKCVAPTIRGYWTAYKIDYPSGQGLADFNLPGLGLEALSSQLSYSPMTSAVHNFVDA